MKSYYLTFCAATLFWSNAAYAKGDTEARALATCAWENVSDTATVLAEIKPKKMHVYDGIAREGAAPYMRVYAACETEWKALKKSVGNTKASYKMLKYLRKTKPKVAVSDRFSMRVFRCVARFPKLTTDDQPAGIWWGYGEDAFKEQLGATYTLFNSQIEITMADLAAIEKRGDGATNFAALLEKTSNQEVAEVETYEAGLESGKSFRIKAVVSNSKCQTVLPNGELTDA